MIQVPKLAPSLHPTSPPLASPPPKNEYNFPRLQSFIKLYLVIEFEDEAADEEHRAQLNAPKAARGIGQARGIYARI